MRQSGKARALAALHDDIRKCRNCPLGALHTQAVPGVGPADAQIMLVGEAPGRQEDLRGEPFVGSAGKFLDELLASVGLTRADVYITNVVKSRPFIGPSPGANRAPTPDEIAACRPWLDEEIRIIQPKIVGAMGRVALDYFFPKTKISDVHGKPMQHDGRTVLPLYHPAVANRFVALRDVIRQDFRKLGKLARSNGHAKAAAPGMRKEALRVTKNTRLTRT